MVVVFHNRHVITKVFDFNNNQELNFNGKTIIQTLFQLAQNNPDKVIGWCHEKLENSINHTSLKTIFHHDLIMASYATSHKYIVPPAIGYVEISTNFLKVKTDVTYPTWLMCSDVGGIHAKVLTKFISLSKLNMSFDIFLNHISNQSIKAGVFCYSEPRLLKENSPIINETYKKINLFSFVKNHYRGRWAFILLLDYFFYENRFRIGAFIQSFFGPKLPKSTLNFSDIQVESRTPKLVEETCYDVLIPTLGRAEYLEDVLKDLSRQTVLPTKIIIVEQNPIVGSETELNYIYEKTWPFEIDHTLIHQMGACNARNIALNKVTSNWVYFADDDIRMEKDLVEDVLKFIRRYGIFATSMASLMKNEKLTNAFPRQWYTFTTNSSFVSSAAIKNIKFGMEHEFGFGEDIDFGMKIRNNGTDIIFYPNNQILHLKAPTGGFRSKVSLPWDSEDVQPKPSPQVMAQQLKHATKEQLLGYKSILFFKFFKSQPNKNPFTYYTGIKKAWDKSIYWATELINKNNADAV